MEFLSVAFWGCFVGHNVTHVFVNVLLLWGRHGEAGRAPGHGGAGYWGWFGGRLSQGLGAGAVGWRLLTGSLSPLSQPCHGWVMQCLRCPVELRDALGCCKKEEVFWLSCLWSWWWKQVQWHPVGVAAFLVQCAFLTLEMGVKGSRAGNGA